MSAIMNYAMNTGLQISIMWFFKSKLMICSNVLNVNSFFNTFDWNCMTYNHKSGYFMEYTEGKRSCSCSLLTSNVMRYTHRGLVMHIGVSEFSDILFINLTNVDLME